MFFVTMLSQHMQVLTSDAIFLSVDVDLRTGFFTLRAAYCLFDRGRPQRCPGSGVLETFRIIALNPSPRSLN